MRGARQNCLLILYLLFMVVFLSCFVGGLSLDRTPASVFVGTLYTAVGSVLVALANPRRAEEVGHNAAEEARRRFGLEHEVRDLLELYRSLLER